MSAIDRFERDLVSRLGDLAEVDDPQLLAEVLSMSRSTKQARGWSRPGWWIPNALPTAAPGRSIQVALLIVALAALLATAALAASQLLNRPNVPRVLGVFEPIAASVGRLGSYDETATLLADGRVLVAGCTEAFGGPALFDPVTRSFAAIEGMDACRSGHGAVLLADGRVLLVGSAAQDAARSAQIFDPRSGTFAPTGQPGEGLYGSTPVRLADGRVLLLGGEAQGATANAELYDPALDTFTATNSMSRPRGRPLAALLPDGRVLVTGGSGGDTPDVVAELYDPVTGTFALTGSMTTPRADFTMTSLADGRVLVAGGLDYAEGGEAELVGPAEVYDPATGAFERVGELNVPRQMHIAIRLIDGRVLIAGGSDSPGGNRPWPASGIRAAEVFDPATGGFTSIAPMSVSRMNMVAVALADGSVLIMGHTNPAPNGVQSDAASAVEIFR